MSTAAEYDALAEALRDLALRLGVSAFVDRRRLISLLSDRLPEARREIRLVGTAIDEGVPAALAGAERHLAGMEMDRQTSRLEAGAGLRPDLAKSIVRAFAYALDLGPLPSVYQDWTAAPSPAPVAPAPGSDWAGISTPVAPAPGHSTYAPPQQPRTGYWLQQGLTPAQPPPATGFRLDQNHLLGLAAAAAIGFGAWQLLSAGDGGQENDPVANTQQGEPAEKGEPTQKAEPAQSERNFAGELDDLGVAAKATLESNVGSPTPLQIPVGRRITTDALQQLLARDSSTLLIDVLDSPHQETIRNAAYLPAAGMPGTLDDRQQSVTAAELSRLVAGKPERPLVFFCMGARCWESYNAVLRANAAGYRNLFWYRGGLASWSAAGLPMQPLQPPSGAGVSGAF